MCAPSTILLIPVLIASFLLAGCESAHVRHADVGVQGRGYDVRVIFSDHDRRLIHEYYSARRSGLPPGLAKQGKVPPGHAMKLHRQQPVPAAAQWQHLPLDLDRRLDRLPDDHVRIVVGGDIAIMNLRSRVVLDLLEDVAD